MRRALFYAAAVATVALVLLWRPWHRDDSLDPDWAATTRVLAGSARGFRDGASTQARFDEPFGAAIAPDGTIYVTDAGTSHRVRRIDPAGRVSTVAGGTRGFADGYGTLARFDTPSAIAIDPAGVLYVADTANNIIRRITPEGEVITHAGDGIAGHRDGPAADARFNAPIGLTIDAGGRVIVADTYNDRIRAIAPDGRVTTIAGSGVPGALDGAGTDARFDTPSGVAVDASGTIYVADTGNSVVRLIDPRGFVSTPIVALPDGLFHPVGVAVGRSGEIYVTDERGRIVEIARGTSRLLTGSIPGFQDGQAEARFRSPTGIAVADAGRLVVCDAGNALVRLVAAANKMDLLPPVPPGGLGRFDVTAFARRPLLWPVAPVEGPHEVAGTLGEARGGEGGERFHAGLDIRKEQGTPVLAVRDGNVSGPLANGDVGTLNEWLRIGDITYVHIRAGRERGDEVFDPERFVPTYDELGKLTRLRVKRGSMFRSGEQIATVNAFNHVHLNVGPSGEEYNPLEFRLTHFADTVPPTIARGGVTLFDSLGQRLTTRVRRRIAVSGRIQIVVDAWDQSNGNRPGRRLGLYDLGYQVLNPDGSPAPGFEGVRHTMRFDRLTRDPGAARLVYAQGSGIPFYGGRRTRFLYIVTNTFRNGVAAEGWLDVSTLLPGDYTIRVWAGDASGNVATANRDLPITVVVAPQQLEPSHR